VLSVIARCATALSEAARERQVPADCGGVMGAWVIEVMEASIRGRIRGPEKVVVDADFVKHGWQVCDE